MRELSALSFSEPDRQLYVTTHPQREQGAPIPSAFRFDNQNPSDGVFLGFVGYRDFVLRCIRHEYGCEGDSGSIPRVPMCAPGVAGTVNTRQGRMLVMKSDQDRGREAALSRVAVSVREALVLRETGESWSDLVGVRGSVQGDHAADVLASPNCLQGGAPGPVPSHEAFRGASGVMEAENAGR